LHQPLQIAIRAFTEPGLEFLLTQRKAVEETLGGLASDDDAYPLRDDPFGKPDLMVK
jgi:hypothetical protein